MKSNFLLICFYNSCPCEVKSLVIRSTRADFDEVFSSEVTAEVCYVSTRARSILFLEKIQKAKQLFLGFKCLGAQSDLWNTRYMI